VRVFVWHEANSFLHALNPLTKLFLCIPVAVLVSFAREPTTPAIVAILALLTTRYLGNLPWSVLARPLLFGLLFASGLFWTYLLFYNGPDTRLVYATAMALRLLAIFLTSALFVLTSDPAQLPRAMIHQLHISPRIAYAVFAAYRFLPLVQVELDNIRAAHQLRGGVGQGGVPSRIREIAGYPIPLLAAGVRRGERVALAMESRAFGALPRRTYFRVMTLGWRDAVFTVVSLLVLAVLAVRLALLLTC
jgi:energy-coupling factor transport system permease protein